MDSDMTQAAVIVGRITQSFNRSQIEQENLAKTILNPGPNPEALLAAWFTLELTGGILLLILLATCILSKNIKRHATLYNLFITLILTSTIESLLLFANKWRFDEPGPSYSLCLLQASLLFGAPAMVCSAAFALIYQMWWTLRNPVGVTTKDGSTNFENRRRRTMVLLMMPYVLLIAIGVPSLIFGAHNPETVNRQRRFFYCNIHKKKLTAAIGVISGVLLFATAVLEAWAALIIRRSWLALSSARQKQTGGTLDRHSVLRVAIFGAYIVLSFFLSFDGIIGSRSVAPDMIRGITPLVIFLIFGTQMDVLRTWGGWLIEPFRHLRGTSEDGGSIVHPGGAPSTFEIDPEPKMSMAARNAAPSIYSSTKSLKSHVPDSPVWEPPRRPFDEESQLSISTTASESLYPSMHASPGGFDTPRSGVGPSPVNGGGTPNSRTWERSLPPSRSTTVDETHSIVGTRTGPRGEWI